jgi:hypothetical protein
MSVSNNQVGQAEATATSPSASAVALLMQAELHNLVARRQELTQRIRTVHRVVRGLREIARERVPNSAYSRRPAHDARLTGRGDLGQPSSVRDKSDELNSELQRACRIALMEAEAAASLEEIYERIVRRGSFSFNGMESPGPALELMLKAMAETGEIRRLGSGETGRWERTSPPKDVEPRPSPSLSPPLNQRDAGTS